MLTDIIVLHFNLVAHQNNFLHQLQLEYAPSVFRFGKIWLYVKSVVSGGNVSPEHYFSIKV